MAKAAPAKLPFEKITPLDHDSPALSTDVYDDAQSPFDDTEMITCPPRIICSPKRTGKTTLVYHIFRKQKNISDLLDEEDCKLILLDGIEEGTSEAMFRQEVVNRLVAPVNCDTLVEMLGSSEVINASANDRIVLAISDADNLSNDALRWLLYNVRQIFMNPIIATSLRCQIVIEGSFSLESVTTVDSEFPLPQLFPRDFTAGEQHAFVRSGLSTLNAHLSHDGHNVLWEHTRGDKYLTQALCLNLIDGMEPSKAKVKFDDTDVHSSIETFLQADPGQEPLKRDWISSFAELSSQFETKEFELRSLLKDMPAQWGVQSERIRALTYQGGIIRRLGPTQLETRPFVMDTFEQVKNRVMQARAIIDAAFSLEGVSEPFAEEARELIQRIMQGAYFDRVRSLHVGEGKKIDERSIEVEALALGQGTYAGKWDISTDASVRVGEPVWAILWSWEDAPGKRSGEIRTFPAKPLI